MPAAEAAGNLNIHPCLCRGAVIQTSFDPKTGQSKEVNIVLDHARNGGMKYVVEEEEKNNRKNSH